VRKRRKSWCSKNHVSYGAHSSEIILHHDLLMKLRRARARTRTRTHTHTHTQAHKWHPLFCSETQKLCNYTSHLEFPFMLLEWATEFNTAVK
jgi:hypothetical protein